MSSWKTLKGIAQSYSHHMQSFFGYIVPHVAEELSKTNILKTKISILPKILIPDNLNSNNRLYLAIESNRKWFIEMLEKQNIEFDIIKSLEIEISLYNYTSMDSLITTIIETNDGKEIRAEVDYIKNNGKSNIQVTYLNNSKIINE